MNERFWELVERADEEGGDDPDIRDEVFAKLLIQECIALGTNFTNRNYSEDAGERIANHFGVEE